MLAAGAMKFITAFCVCLAILPNRFLQTDALQCIDCQYQEKRLVDGKELEGPKSHGDPQCFDNPDEVNSATCREEEGFVARCTMGRTRVLKTEKYDECAVGWPVVKHTLLNSAGLTMIAIDKPFECNGELVEWRFFPKNSNPFRAIVFRQVDESETQFQVVGINDIPGVPREAVNLPFTYSVPKDQRIKVESGDMIGWSSGQSVIAYYYGGDYRVRWVGGNQYASLDVDGIIDVNAGVSKRQQSIEATVIKATSVQAKLDEIPLVGQPTSQSSTHDESKSPADKAIDGNTHGVYYRGYCSHTSQSPPTTSPWWMVDMDDTQCVGKVEIFNRADCCADRLEGAVVRVGSDSNRDNQVCGNPITLDQINANQKIEVSCNLQGRYLSIEIPGEDKILPLCEVRAIEGQCAIVYEEVAVGRGCALFPESIDPGNGELSISEFLALTNSSLDGTLIQDGTYMYTCSIDDCNNRSFPSGQTTSAEETPSDPASDRPMSSPTSNISDGCNSVRSFKYRAINFLIFGVCVLLLLMIIVLILVVLQWQRVKWHLAP